MRKRLSQTHVLISQVAGKRDIAFVVESTDGSSREEIKTSFFGPAP